MLQCYQSVQISHIAVHTENTFGRYDYLLVSGSFLLENLFQMLIVVVAIPEKRCTTQQQTIDDAGMNQLIGHQQSLLVCQGRQDTSIGMITTIEYQSCLAPECFCQKLFQNLVFGKVARQQTRRRRRQRAIRIPQPIQKFIP